MNRTVNLLGLAALLGLCLCAFSPVIAREPPPVPPPDGKKGGDLPADKPKVEPAPDVQKQIQDLQDQITKLKTDPRFLKIDSLEGDVRRLTEEVRGLKTSQEQMKNEILAAIQKQQSPPRVAMEVFGQAPPTGTIRLVNNTQWNASIILDRVSYTLAPGAAQTLPRRPAGPFGYEVLVDGWGTIQPFVMRTLRTDETRIITINPPQAVVAQPVLLAGQ
jgi:hypothetical protein